MHVYVHTYKYTEEIDHFWNIHSNVLPSINTLYDLD